MSELKWLVTKWKFKSSTDQDWLPAQVPGCVHTDLLRNGLIPNPFEGKNEIELQWIDRKDWEYETEFDAPEQWLVQSQIELVFEGLDTYAAVYLNDNLILSADNMFRTWTAEVKPLLHDSGNRLRIVFRSAIQEGLSKLEANGFGYPAPNDDSSIGGLEERKLSVFSRKAPYHYGWDWGPRFVTSGISKNISIQGWTGYRIRDLFIRQDQVSADFAKITAVVQIQSEVEGIGKLIVTSDNGMSWDKQVQLSPGSQTVEIAIDIASPKLWWSRGLGEASLYTFNASFSADNGQLTSKSVRTGLRSVKLIRKPDNKGTSFYFELNGIPVFAKGANHIPNDSFFNEVTEERYRHEIASAAESNMNMLRVWGGGLYEQDIFYDLCDEYGILVWQDFMFACSMYPGDQAFLDNVREEAIDNIRRLRNHPSIALWCGNNEIDTAWSQFSEDGGWGWKQRYTAEQRDKIWTDYEAIFHRVLPEVVEEYAPDIEYWPSSPMQAITNNVEQHATNNSSNGDIHFWAVWHASEPFENYKLNVGRFMSEYGFQSFPEHKTVSAYANKDQMALDSDVMLHHQKNGRGNFLIKEYSEKYLKDPKDFVSFLYMSQVLQAEGMKIAIEAHRRNKDYCMGTLYWQMNDCWPVASWSSMDYYGRWKAVQYYVARSFRDVMVSIEQTEDSIEFHVVTDILQPIQATLKWTLYDFEGNALKSDSHPVDVPVNGAVKALQLQVVELLENYSAENTVLVGRLIQDGRELDSKEHYFRYSKHLALSMKPNIEITEIQGSSGTAYTLNARSLAKQVWLQSEEEGIFSDNYFDLVPGVPKTVIFKKRIAESAAFIQASPGKLDVKSMVDFVGR
ncbi:beta-mannosidase [Cohnella lupini]|uniref:Beta-mannosidase n=1 Tax=Cohnella lupini TaxID=1294267 RepID=A0A3D9HZB1_9BACL|nr:glycoside hydrolase family 2 protein [Cohnella lupini]RED54750.1 beta-mannosidase [Cohnella lupini]